MLVDFYHLASSPLERVLPSICEKILANGERLLVVGDGELLGRLDEQLWSYAKEAFLPHGISAQPRAEEQPVLLSTEPAAVNGAVNIAIVDGRWREEALGFARAVYFFGNSHLDTARGSWRAVKGRDGVECRYWKQDERGKWVQGP